MDLKADVTLYSSKSGVVERRKESGGPESSSEGLSSSQMLQGTVFKNKVGRMYAKA
jgi:hypothetical protein